jgi:deazaflavin-dependent oxidoreductase (nitroreductase family)
MAVQDLKDALQTTREIVITVKGRSSGRDISNPVWFVQDGDALYVLPVRGSDADWYRNIVKTPTVGVAADGWKASLEAKPVTDPAKVAEVVDKFRAKYGADVDKYYANPDVAVEIPLAQ